MNVGCIPSKALLDSSHRYSDALNHFSDHGIEVSKPKLDIPKMMERKNKVVAQLTAGVGGLFKANKVTAIFGEAKVLNSNQVEVLIDNKSEIIETKNIVIASGSLPINIPVAPIDQKNIVDSTGALEFLSVPKKLGIIGAGVIGLELGSVYSRLGSSVKVIEFSDKITPGMLMAALRLDIPGLEFEMNAAVTSTKTFKNKVKVNYIKNADKSEHSDEAGMVLIATGRTPVIDHLQLSELNIQVSPTGRVVTDGNWMTNINGIYAIGDVIDGPMLAHKAEDEGMATAEVIAGKHGHVNYGVIPGVIYTHPEVANVGMTEDALKDSGRAYKVGKFSFMGNGRAKANFAADGFVKILADKTTDRILGAHIIGPMAGDLIHEICVAMEFGASAEDLARTCHAHPTYSEAVREAALACGAGAIHG